MTTRRSSAQLRQDAVAIWRAGVDAVASDRLVQDNVRVTYRTLQIGDDEIPLDRVHRICVVGAGKAGAGMAAGLEAALGTQVLRDKQVAGWLNVPADCVRPLQAIHLHAARPPGVNEPTVAAAEGCQQILRLVSELDADDLCICLISGGGSALLPAPAQGITLEQKLALTQHLSGAGANIEQLNTVRKQLSRIKGGGLARACRAGRLITLIISDVLGDRLDVIASGPTVPDTSTPRDAMEVLHAFPLADKELETAIIGYLEQQQAAGRQTEDSGFALVSNIIIGNNSVAVDAAGMEAERRGYSHAMVTARKLEGDAETIGRHLARMAQQMRDAPGPDCLVSGGEPTVKLVDPAERGLGGRNQQLVLAAYEELITSNGTSAALDGIAILAGGTDGEDGPTDAAGALIDYELADAARVRRLDAGSYLLRNDAYHFFQQVDGLLKTGPTHTNVCDLRIVLVARVEVPR